MKSNLIALVTVIAFINGVRTEIPPGESIPEGLSDHDIRELKAMRAIEDEAERRQERLNEEEDHEDGMRAFQAARERVQLQQSSIAPDAPSGDADGQQHSAGLPPAAKNAPAAKSTRKR